MFLETKEDGTIEELGKAFFGIFSQYPISDKALEDFHKTELFKDLQNYYPSKEKQSKFFKKIQEGEVNSLLELIRIFPAVV